MAPDGNNGNGTNVNRGPEQGQWKKSFLDKLGQAQQRCALRFEEAIDTHIVSVFDEVAAFVREHGFRTSMPLHESGRRSFKFELVENAYMLLIFRFVNVGEFELRSELFVPGCEPILRKAVGRVADIDAAWAQRQFRGGLDQFVDLLAGTGNKDFALAEMSAS